MALVCVRCGTYVSSALQACSNCGSRTAIRPPDVVVAPDENDPVTKASAVRTLVGTLLALPAIGILAALGAGLVSGSTALLMLFLIAGGQFDDGRWSWFIGFAAFYGLYGLLMVAQEIALARQWISGRSAPFEMVGRIFGGFQVG